MHGLVTVPVSSLLTVADAVTAAMAVTGVAGGEAEAIGGVDFVLPLRRCSTCSSLGFCFCFDLGFASPPLATGRPAGSGIPFACACTIVRTKQQTNARVCANPAQLWTMHYSQFGAVELRASTLPSHSPVMHPHPLNELPAAVPPVLLSTSTNPKVARGTG